MATTIRRNSNGRKESSSEEGRREETGSEEGRRKETGSEEGRREETGSEETGSEEAGSDLLKKLHRTGQANLPATALCGVSFLYGFHLISQETHTKLYGNAVI